MAKQVSATAMLKCTSGDASSPLEVLDERVLCEMLAAANILDFAPAVNIMPFGTCKVLTSAAGGTPTPCVPAVILPWTPGCPSVLVRGAPALNNTSTCACTVGGTISITSPGCTKEEIP